MHIKNLFVTAALALSLSVPALAAESDSNAVLKQQLEKMLGSKPDRISKAPIDGILEVAYGMNIFYVTADGHYLLHGQMYDLNSRTNLTEQRLSSERVTALKDLDKSSMIVYKAKGKEKHVITVFTDIDCPYCRKLHEGMKQMNDLGITVRYLAFPRAGVGSPSYYKAESVWCAADRNQAMDDAKLRGKVVQKRCDDSPVKAQYELGQKIGVTGTPAIILDNGKLMPGYAPPQKLAAMLDQARN
jgi:thiol:disulfide interchange protein DsbC